MFRVLRLLLETKRTLLLKKPPLHYNAQCPLSVIKIRHPLLHIIVAKAFFMVIVTAVEHKELKHEYTFTRDVVEQL